jgi:hypothetical protein
VLPQAYLWAALVRAYRPLTWLVLAAAVALLAYFLWLSRGSRHEPASASGGTGGVSVKEEGVFPSTPLPSMLPDAGTPADHGGHERAPDHIIDPEVGSLGDARSTAATAAAAAAPRGTLIIRAVPFATVVVNDVTLGEVQG